MSSPLITSELQAFYEENGYVVVPGLFDPTQVQALTDHFMALRAAGPHPGDMVADVPREGDPLERFPRMLHMHRWDDTTRRWLLDARLNQCLTALVGAEPYAAQSMLYFKPPGARGQAVHQDNYYLQVKPGICMAAWMALDRCDEANGCMRVVPGSHKWPILCAVDADPETSFTGITVPLPEEAATVPVLMEAGDVLFFHGALVHGSSPNTTTDRFRRSLIGHYVERGTQELTHYDLPAMHMDGSPVAIAPSPGGGPCGGSIDLNGRSIPMPAGLLPAPHPEDYDANAAINGLVAGRK